jgi:hypothetical protein
MTPSRTHYIPLTQGQFAKVDADLFDWLSQWNWCAKWYPESKSFYAVRSTSNLSGARTLIPMHRQILGLDRLDKQHGDHKDHDTLNNQRANLRITTHAQNQWNSKRPSHNKSGYKGVIKFKGREKYYANIVINGKGKYLGSFDDPAVAHQAYCEAAKKYFGEFAHDGVKVLSEEEI